jgi:pimeloyl-ACP methyl ester carboxylesterase
MPTVRLVDADLYYEEHGDPDGQPLMLVHGFSGTGSHWTPFLSRYADYRLIVPDLRGHCRSSGSVDTIHHANFGDDLIALLDHLGIERAHFVGHSSGGMCLLFVGQRHLERVRTLSLVSATYTFDDHAKGHMRKIMEELPGSPQRIADLDQTHASHRGDEYWRTLKQAFLEFTYNDDELPFDPTSIGWLTQPVLVLHGDRDEFFPVYIPTRLYEGLPRGELAIFPNTGHDLPVALPDMFVDVVRSFLDRHRDA